MCRFQCLLHVLFVRTTGYLVAHVHGVADHRSYRVSFAHIREKLGFVPRRTVDDAISEVHAVLRGVHDYADKVYHNAKQLQRNDRRRIVGSTNYLCTATATPRT